MPHALNNVFGVLADPEMMSKLNSRGRAKPFEKEMAEQIKIDKENQLVRTIQLRYLLVEEIEDLGLRNHDDDDEFDDEDEAEGDNVATEEEAEIIDAHPHTPTQPSPDHDQDNLNDAPTTPLLRVRSGKPSHRLRRDNLLLATPTLTPIPAAQLQPIERFTFTNRKTYARIRALFAIDSEPEHALRLRWIQVQNLLTEPPVKCTVMKPGSGGNGYKFFRPARRAVGSDLKPPVAATAAAAREENEHEGEGEDEDEDEEDANENWIYQPHQHTPAPATPAPAPAEGQKNNFMVPKATATLHSHHGGGPGGRTAWVDRNCLENMAEELCKKFGWERGSFVFDE